MNAPYSQQKHVDGANFLTRTYHEHFEFIACICGEKMLSVAEDAPSTFPPQPKTFLAYFSRCQELE